MVNFASGSGETALFGIETTPGTIPVTAAADRLPVTSLQLAPDVATYEDKAMVLSGAAREVVYGKPGGGGSFAVTASRESLLQPFRFFYGTIVKYGVVGWYDYYFSFTANQPSFFAEEYLSDADTPTWIAYLGNKISQFQGGIDPEGLMEATFNCVGLGMKASESELVTGTITDRTSSRAIDYIPTVLIEGPGGVELGYGSRLEWTADRRLARKSAIDHTPRALFVKPTATRKLDVKLSAYFKNKSLLDKALNSTETYISALCQAPESGHGAKLIWPCGKYKPFGPKSQGQDVIMQDIESDFYSRGTASNVAGEALGKFFTSVTIVGGTNDSFKVKVDGAAAITITLTAGLRTFAQILSQVAAALTPSGSAVGEFLTYDTDGVVTGGRLRLASSQVTLSGSASSIQVDATGTAQATLGFDTVLHPGFDAVDMMARISCQDGTFAGL